MRIVKAVVSADRKECAVYLDNGEKLEGVLGIELRSHYTEGATVKIEARILGTVQPDGTIEVKIQ